MSAPSEGDISVARSSGDQPNASLYLDQRWRIVLIGVSALMVVALVLVTDSFWGRHSFPAMLIESAGQCLIMTAVLGRLWATLYIGGRKNASLVTTGPYSLSRNPLYCFSIIGAVGAGLALGSIAAALLLGGATWLLLYRAARREAALLSGSFGATYAIYAGYVPLLWPRFTRYEDTCEPSFNPAALGRALRDALLFLLIVPVAEFVHYAKDASHLPGLFPLA